MKLRDLSFAVTVAFAVLAPSIASAGPLWDIHTDAKGGVGQLQTIQFTFNGHSETGLAGTLTSMPTPGGVPFDTYCIDLYHSFQLGGSGSNWEVEVLPISSFTGDVGVNSPDNPGGNAGAIGYLYSKYAAGVSTGIEGAALQVAIWKVAYDDSNSFSTGSFQFAATSNDPDSVQSLVFAQATAYLSGFDGTQTNFNATYLRATSHPNGGNQDFVGPGSLSVPEPASLAMVACGLGAVALARRRKGGRHARVA